MESNYERGLTAALKLLRRDAPATASTNTGRNHPCPCGSGKKYKKCCLRTGSKPVAPMSQPGDMGAAAAGLSPRIDNDAEFVADLQELSAILSTMPAATLDEDAVADFLEDHGLSEIQLIEGPGDEFDAMAVRFCRKHVSPWHWDEIGRLLLRELPYHIDSIDELRAILTGLFVLEYDDNPVWTIMFRHAVRDRLSGAFQRLAGTIASLKDESEDLTSFIQRLDENKDAQLINAQLGKSNGQVAEDFEVVQRQVAELISSHKYPLPVPWPLRLAMLVCTSDLDDLSIDSADTFVKRLHEEMSEDDERLIAHQLSEVLAGPEEVPYRKQLTSLALLCHAGLAENMLALLAISTIQTTDAHFNFPIEYDVVSKGSSASDEEVEALATAYQDEGFPAIADRIRRHHLETFRRMDRASEGEGQA